MLTIRQALAASRDQDGATAVEYAIMVALIAAVIIAAVVLLGNQAENTFNCTAESINTNSNVC